MYKKNLMFRNIGRAIVCVALVLVFLGTVSEALAKNPKPIHLKFSNFIVPTQTSGPIIIELCKRLEKASRGKVKIDLYWGEALGKAPEQLDMVREGLADIALFFPIYTPARFPLSLFLELPFVAPDSPTGTEVVLELLKRGLIMDEYKEVTPLALFNLPPSHVFSKKKITRVEDFKGLRIWGKGPVWTQTWSILGASTVSMGWQDIYMGLERGTIDAVGSHWGGATKAKWYEAANYALNISIMGGFFGGVIMNNDSWNKLPPEVSAAWTKMRDENARYYAKALHEDSLREEQVWHEKSKGGIVEVPLAEQERIAEMLVPVWQNWIDRNEAAGKPAKEIYRTYVEVFKRLGKPVLVKFPGLYK